MKGILRIGVFPFESNMPSTRKNRLRFNYDQQYLNMFLSTNKSKDTKNSLFGSMRGVIFIAQCFSMLPVQGFNSKNSSNLRFKWQSFRVVYSICAIISSFSLFVFSLLNLRSINFTFKNAAGLVFHGSTTFILITFLYYASRWPAFVYRWEAMEKELSLYGYPLKIAFKINLITALILLGAFVEHLLSNLPTLHQVHRCHSKANGNLFYEFSIIHVDILFSIVPYHFLLSLYVIVVRIIATFSWNFLDLFIMLLTLSLAERFKQINMELYRIEGKMNISSGVWQRFRLDYNALTQLTKFLDNEIGAIILLSFGSNLYFICLQLFNSTNPLTNVFDTVYFYWSFLYLILRASLVSFFGARIYDQSRMASRILYSVPSECYCKEVERFIQQVTSDNVTITGMGFFSITRNILITIAGTIITYEILIVQMNNHEADTDSPNNTTNSC